MANFLQQIKLDEELYDLHDSEFIIDNRTASGAALTGVSKAPALFDGMQITYWLNYAAGTNATLNLTLADGTKTGAIPIYYSGTTRLTTHYGAGNAIRMVYRENAYSAGTARGEGWWCDANYYSDSNYDIFGTAMDVDTAIYNYSLFAITGHNGTIAKQTNTNEAGTYWKANSFTQSGGNGTSKKATTKGYYPYKIFYNPNNTSYTTAGGNTSTVSSGTSNLDLRYTVNGTTSANIGATGAPFFLVGTIESDGLFYLKGNQATKEWWTAGIPTTKNTDYVYWFVGMMSSAYQVRLSDRNWFLKWTGTGDNDKLICFEPWFTVEHAESADSVPWSGVTGKPTSFTPSSHTHGYISNDGAIADSVAATPASGDKIVVTDASDSNKVKGAITIGSDDGKFLKHDGTWDTPSSLPDPPASDGAYVLRRETASEETTLDWENETIVLQIHDRHLDSDYDSSTMTRYFWVTDLDLVNKCLTRFDSYLQEGKHIELEISDIDITTVYDLSKPVQVFFFLFNFFYSISPQLNSDDASVTGVDYNYCALLASNAYETADIPNNNIFVGSYALGGGSGNNYIIDVTYNSEEDTYSVDNSAVLPIITQLYTTADCSAAIRIKDTQDNIVEYYENTEFRVFSDLSAAFLIGTRIVPEIVNDISGVHVLEQFGIGIVMGSGDPQISCSKLPTGSIPTASIPYTTGTYVLDIYNTPAGGSASWVSAPRTVTIPFSTQDFLTFTCTSDYSYTNLVDDLNSGARVIMKMGTAAGVEVVSYQINTSSARVFVWVSTLYPDSSFFGIMTSMLAFRDDNGTLAGGIAAANRDSENLPVIGYASSGTLPTLSYTPTTSSQASLSNGLLSFSSISSSNISGWNAGSIPTLQYGSGRYVEHHVYAD